MKTEKVKYTAQFENGRIVAQWIGIEGSPEGNETPDEVFLATVNQVNKWHQMTDNQSTAPGQQGPPIIIERGNPQAALAADMKSCTEFKVLETYKLLIRGNTELQEIYDKKASELKK